MSDGPYPIYGPDDENAQNFPMPGDNPVPQFESIEYDICPGCDGHGGDYLYDDETGDRDGWVICDHCDGTGRL